MTWLENHHMKLIHRNKVLCVNGVEHSLTGHCIETEPISVLLGQIITYTCRVVLESLWSTGTHGMVIIGHMDTGDVSHNWPL